jgi:hypothetical protein
VNSEVMSFSGRGEGPGSARVAWSGPRFMRRFRQFIEHADWERMILSHPKRQDLDCVGVLVVAALYFLPILATAFLR